MVGKCIKSVKRNYPNKFSNEHLLVVDFKSLTIVNKLTELHNI